MFQGGYAAGAWCQKVLIVVYGELVVSWGFGQGSRMNAWGLVGWACSQMARHVHAQPTKPRKVRQQVNRVQGLARGEGGSQARGLCSVDQDTGGAY